MPGGKAQSAAGLMWACCGADTSSMRATVSTKNEPPASSSLDFSASPKAWKKHSGREPPKLSTSNPREPVMVSTDRGQPSWSNLCLQDASEVCCGARPVHIVLHSRLDEAAGRLRPPTLSVRLEALCRLIIATSLRGAPITLLAKQATPDQREHLCMADEENRGGDPPFDALRMTKDEHDVAAQSKDKE